MVDKAWLRLTKARVRQVYRRAGLTRRLSVGHILQLAMLVLMIVAGLQMMSNQRAMSSSAFMLRRAEISYGQLGTYQQLSIAALEYIVANELSADAQQIRIDTQLRQLDASVNSEADFVRENGGDETNLAERGRVEKIKAVFDELFAARATHSNVEGIYRNRLKPLLDEAVSDEKAETTIVEHSMRNTQRTMLGLGWLGVLAQAVVAAGVLGVVELTALGPLKSLVADIGEFGRGRLTHRAVVRRHDEFGLLAQHINRMARHLDYRTNELVEVNRTLEATVAERTHALRERNEELQEIDASRRRFFVDVSHELRTPLTAIVGEADIALRNKATTLEASRDALASVLANSIYLNRRIDDLMALAKSSSGQLDLERQTVDLNLIAAEALTEVQSLAKVNEVHVDFEPLTRPVLAEGDRLRLRQCLMILLDNAVKFSPAQGRIEIRLEVDRDAAKLSVRDRGRGIDTDELPVIFERYYQTEIGRRKGGTGIGLAIARRIVEAHRGAIVAAKADGGGTVMALTIPILESDPT